MLPITPTVNEINRIRLLPTAIRADAPEMVHWIEERGQVTIDYWFELGQWFCEISQPASLADQAQANDLLAASAPITEDKPQATVSPELRETIARLEPSIAITSRNDGIRYLQSPSNYIHTDVYLVEDVTELGRFAAYLRESLTQLDNIVKTIVIKRNRKLIDEGKLAKERSTGESRSPKPSKDPKRTERVAKKLSASIQDKEHKKLYALMVAMNLDIENWATMDKETLKAAIKKANGGGK